MRMPQYKAVPLAERLCKTLHERHFVGSIRHWLRFSRNVTHAWLWDARHGVETRHRVWVGALGASVSQAEHAIHYEASGTEWVGVMRRLALSWNNFTFIDLGSGKGKCLMLASELPFHRIIGVELSQKVNEAAAANLHRFRSRNQRCRTIELVTSDAASFEFPACPLVIYMFHPFDEVVMRTVVEKIRRSAVEIPREVFVIYRRPLLRRLFDEVALFQLVDQYHDGVVYSALASRASCG